MIVTTYICDCCGAQSSNQASFNTAPVVGQSTVTSVSALLCSPCIAAASTAAQAALNARKGTFTGTVLS
jgi:hypothetical protein